MNTKKTRYSQYNLNYHLVWIPKYRRKVLTGKVAQRLDQIFGEIVDNNRVEIISSSIQPDYVHLFVSAPPKWSPSSLVNLFKGASSRKLRQEFPSLKKVHREKLWTRTYYVGTAGNVSSETIQRYIEECQD